MAGRSEAVYSEGLAFTRHYEGPPADQAGAEERRKCRIIALFAERKTISGIRDEVAGEAPITGVAGEFGAIAEIFLVCSAVEALTAGGTEPGNTDPCA